MPTVRNARGADLYAASSDESIVLAIQSKALSSRVPVPLGASLENLRSKWWIITINATSDFPTCFVMTLNEVKASAHKGVSPKSEKISYWLQPKMYDLEEYKEAWHRLGEP